LTTSLKTGADFEKPAPTCKSEVEKPAPTFKLGFRRRVNQQAHSRPVKRERQKHEPQEEMMNKEING
jgi:hypothetical protein